MLEFKVLGTYAEPTNAKNLFEIKLKSLLEWDNLMNPAFYAFMRSGRRISGRRSGRRHVLSSLHCKYHINFQNFCNSAPCRYIYSTLFDMQITQRVTLHN